MANNLECDKLEMTLDDIIRMNKLQQKGPGSVTSSCYYGEPNFRSKSRSRSRSRGGRGRSRSRSRSCHHQQLQQQQQQWQSNRRSRSRGRSQSRQRRSGSNPRQSRSRSVSRVRSVSRQRSRSRSRASSHRSFTTTLSERGGWLQNHTRPSYFSQKLYHYRTPLEFRKLQLLGRYQARPRGQIQRRHFGSYQPMFHTPFYRPRMSLTNLQFAQSRVRQAKKILNARQRDYFLQLKMLRKRQQTITPTRNNMNLMLNGMVRNSFPRSPFLPRTQNSLFHPQTQQYDKTESLSITVQNELANNLASPLLNQSSAASMDDSDEPPGITADYFVRRTPVLQGAMFSNIQISPYGTVRKTVVNSPITAVGDETVPGLISSIIPRQQYTVHPLSSENYLSIPRVKTPSLNERFSAQQVGGSA